MKTVTFFQKGGKLMLFFFILVISAILFSLISCSKGNPPSGNSNNSNPDPPPSAPPPKINSFTPNGSDIIVNYNGLDSGAVLFSWSTSNGSATFNGEAVPSLGGKSINAGYDNKEYILRVTNSVTGLSVQETKKTIITIDSTLAKITGNTSAGQSWKIVDIMSESPSGNISHFLFECIADDVFTFYPNCKYRTNYGSDSSCPKGEVVNAYLFNPSTLVFSIPNGIPAQPDRTVTFTSPTTMHFTYVYYNYTYTLYYQRV